MAKRDKRIFIPVTQEEKDWIQSVVDRSIYGNMANYCREILFLVTKFMEQTEGDDLKIEMSDKPFDDIEWPQ